MRKLIIQATLLCALATPMHLAAQCPSLFLSRGSVQVGGGIARSGAADQDLAASLSFRFLHGTLAGVNVQQSRIDGVTDAGRGGTLTLGHEFGLGAFAVCPSAGIGAHRFNSESSSATGTISTQTIPLALAIGHRIALGAHASVTAVVEGIVDARRESSESVAPDGWVVSWQDQKVATGGGAALTLRVGRVGVAARYNTALGSDAQTVGLALLIGTK